MPTAFPQPLLSEPLADHRAGGATARPAFAMWLAGTNDISQQFLAIGSDPAMISLAGGLPAPELYPVQAVSEATQRAIARRGSAMLEYGPVEGLPDLRAAIAARAARETGARLTAENVMITSGAMQGLDLIGKVFIDAGDLIVTQVPAYLGALDAWRPRGPAYAPLDWSVDAGDEQHRLLQRAKFVYAVPNFSNPTGVLVPASQREALLRRVEGANTWLLEDDPYCALHYDGPAQPTLLALHAAGQRGGPYDGPVIYLGTFSKTLCPGLRVGWAIAGAHTIQALARVKMSTDLSGCMFTQAVALELLDAGVDTALHPAIVDTYRERRDALCAQAAQQLSEWFEWQVPPGGMFVWMRARRPEVNTDVLYRFALEEKVAFVPGSVFDPTGASKHAMRVNFTRATPSAIAQGVTRLARATRRYIEHLG